MKKGRNKSFTPKQVQRLKDMKAEGVSLREISRIFGGVSTNTISDYIKGKRTA